MSGGAGPSPRALTSVRVSDKYQVCGGKEFSPPPPLILFSAEPALRSDEPREHDEYAAANESDFDDAEPDL